MRALRFTTTFLALAVGAAFAPAAAAAATRYVTLTGSDADACTQSAPCRTIQGALDKTPELDPGDVIDVGPGRFGQPFNVSTAGITVRGAKTGISGAVRTPGASGETELRSAQTGDFRVSGGFVTFDGLTTMGSGFGVSGSGFTYANNLSLEAASGIGVSSNGANLTVRSSRFIENQVGVRQAGPGLDIQGSVFERVANTNAVTGIQYVSPSALGTVAFNRFVGTMTAIQRTMGQGDPVPSNFFGCNGGPGATGCSSVQGVDASSYLRLRLDAAATTAEVATQVPLRASLVTTGTGTAPTGIGAFPATPIAFSASPATASATPASASTGGVGAAVSAITSSAPGTATATASLDNATANASVLFTAAPVQPVQPVQPVPAQPAAPSPVTPPDTVTPRITGSSFSSNRFAVDTRAGASAVARGTKLSLTLSEPATVVFVTQQRVGRRWRTIRVFGKRLATGRSTLEYSGRIKPRGKTRSLRPGRYRLRMRPSDRAGNRGAVTTRYFRIEE